jgi:predicted flap endonuclease-1-like 5' DNA nuclease
MLPMTNTQTSASGLGSLPEGTATITTMHLAIIAVLAVLAILGILWGIRQKRGRVQAHEDVIDHAKEAGVPPEASAAPPEPPRAPEPAVQSQSQVQFTAPPVAPAPPPIADEPVLATPEPIANEPIAASFDASPATEIAPPAPAPMATYADEPVTQLKGLGPKVAGRLAELGVTTIGQMAALSDDQAESIDAQLGAFTGRMGRDRWIEQARFLAAGDRAGFEAVFGKL